MGKTFPCLFPRQFRSLKKNLLRYYFLSSFFSGMLLSPFFFSALISRAISRFFSSYFSLLFKAAPANFSPSSLSAWLPGKESFFLLFFGRFSPMFHEQGTLFFSYGVFLFLPIRKDFGREFFWHHCGMNFSPPRGSLSGRAGPPRNERG